MDTELWIHIVKVTGTLFGTGVPQTITQNMLLHSHSQKMYTPVDSAMEDLNDLQAAHAFSHILRNRRTLLLWWSKQRNIVMMNIYY